MFFYRKVILPFLAVFFGLFPKRLPEVLPSILWYAYRNWYDTLKVHIIEYHKDALWNLDFRYKMSEVGQEIIRQREHAREQGIGPLDPRYPDIDSVLGKNRPGRHW